jgi:hypothetical protein
MQCGGNPSLFKVITILKSTEMYNENEPMSFDEIMRIEDIELTNDKLVDINHITCAMRRYHVMGIVVTVNKKNQLISGHEWLILATQMGHSEIKVKRKEPLTLKSKF